MVELEDLELEESGVKTTACLVRCLLGSKVACEGGTVLDRQRQPKNAVNTAATKAYW